LDHLLSWSIIENPWNFILFSSGFHIKLNLILVIALVLCLGLLELLRFDGAIQLLFVTGCRLSGSGWTSAGLKVCSKLFILF